MLHSVELLIRNIQALSVMVCHQLYSVLHHFDTQCTCSVGLKAFYTILMVQNALINNSCWWLYKYYCARFFPLDGLSWLNLFVNEPHGNNILVNSVDLSVDLDHLSRDAAFEPCLHLLHLTKYKITVLMPVTPYV